LRREEFNPTFLIKKEDVFSFSDPAFIELFKAVLNKKAAFRFKAKGFSMSPFIKDGDAITVANFFDVGPKWAEIVAFIHPETEKLIVHRVVARRKEFYIIKGDNACKGDGFVPRENIIGRVTKVERKGKRVFFGFGPERFLIAMFSHKKVLLPLLFPIRILVRLITKKPAI